MSTSDSSGVAAVGEDAAKHLSLEFQSEWWRRLQDLVAARAQAEKQAAETFRTESTRIERHFETTTRQRTETYERDRAATQAEYDKVVAATESLFCDDRDAAQAEFDEVLFDLLQQTDHAVEQAKKKHEEDQWMVASYFDEQAEGSPRQQFELFRTNQEKTREQLRFENDELESQKRSADLLMLKRRQGLEVDQPRPEKTTSNDLDATAAQFREACEAVRTYVVALGKLRIPALFQGWRPHLAGFIAWLVLWGIVGFAVDPVIVANLLSLETPPDRVEWLVISGVVMLFPISIALWILLSVGRGQSHAIYEPLFERYVTAQRLRQRWLKLADTELKEREQKFLDWQKVISAKREAGLRKANGELAVALQQIEETREKDHAAAMQKYPALLKAIEEHKDEQLRAAENEFPQRLVILKAQFQADLDRLKKQHDIDVATCGKQFQQDWLAMADHWLQGFQQLQSDAEAANRLSDEWFRDWQTLGNAPLKLPAVIPPAMRLGHFVANLSDIPDGVPTESQLMPSQTGFTLPACLPFPERPSLLLKVTDEGRAAAVEVLQNTMLRLLTTVPGGKVRFTILDPVGLGDNFAAFMHLADFDELMITGRIWTEQQQIEQRLTDLTEHMENVFQKYLRNEFRSIQEYNEHAGEVAEPYHVLVVANFPANFNDQAARRLISIATSGPRCGVFVLASVDLKQRLPLNFDLKDLEASSTVFDWTSQLGFVSTDVALSELPLRMDAPPDPDLFTRLVRAAGHESKDARRVEVAFERIAPKDAQLWTSDSRSGLDVPLGRAGATKLQHLRLGRGTSQHVLVAGKTGSGKSTFLHILITNAALHYGPDQVEFYLIDFKKGVEFKTYATHELPHARVIAIESDREFGVSVLERLDGILKERGDLFREIGVQDLAGFRDARPSHPMPRILLIVDEFQEFFVEDDKHSQTAALLLDRLVRQGRAFGIHVLLGSQTLGGAYSLARSTLGQMAVRIALQCSESDAHLILSEDNTAARLLTRPGEAIYNDANGMVEGNHPFQIAWLDEDRRERQLDRVQALAERRHLQIPHAIVFEGNIPADPRRNVDLSTLIESPLWDDSLPERIAWLGEAVAIKDPTTVSFRAQGGQNLLIVGQSEPSAIGLLSASLVSLACQIDPRRASADDDSTLELPARFIILDGSQGVGAATETWTGLKAALPHDVHVGDSREAADVVASLAAEIERREQSGLRDEAPIFLIVFNLGRFRDLRKSDDDFGFSFGSGEKKVSPGKQFIDVLKNGPGLGIHTLVWSDTYNNVSRWFSSQALREFELRVVFQLSASDSSNLIDSPLASRLGTNRAILHLLDQGSNEKFRPYGIPTSEWLDGIAAHWRTLAIDKPIAAAAAPRT